jgi:hypothetical protein
MKRDTSANSLYSKDDASILSEEEKVRSEREDREDRKKRGGDDKLLASSSGTKNRLQRTKYDDI